MIISSTLENDNILAFKNDNIYGVIIYVIIYLMLSFDIIISHSLQMLSFLCYNFSLYSMGVIIYVII